MLSIRPLPEFTAWLDGLTDKPVRGVIAARLKRLALGLMGDVEPVGEGVSELHSLWRGLARVLYATRKRLDCVAGWRL